MDDINRKKIFKGAIAVSLGLAILFMAYSGLAYTREPTTIDASYETAYVEKGELTHMGFFTNESVYMNGTSLEYYPEKITDYITGNYVYSTKPQVAAHYKLTLKTDYYVTSGKEKIYIVNTSQALGEGDFPGTFSVPVTFNITDMEKSLKQIREGTGLYRANADVYLLVRVSSNGRDEFTQRISLASDTTGMLTLRGTEKEYQKVVRHVNTTVNTVNFLGKEVNVSTARTVFPAMAVLFIIPPLGFAYFSRERKVDELKGLRKFIVEGVPSDIGAIDPVNLESVEDLEKVFDLVDKPIVHYRQGDEDVYAIVDGDVIYEYRKPLPGEGREAN
ncbi:hypothetical protein FH039_02350 [Thermococcus indicus]|uniref:DUF5305 domain-containing protein n=2 Tax=Thermococcus indicus TaxID=2586643 RepID=A0A4Y5SQD3_9EURY|nr:hypothetical protein FH039_02350 [Thermococcus indicus]